MAAAVDIDKVVDVARMASVMVRIHGPDPKGRKMQRHAFSHSESGDTTLSASGLLLPGHFHGTRNIATSHVDRTLLVITCASLIEPFLSKNEGSARKGAPTLIYGAKIDVLTEVSKGTSVKVPGQQSSWLPATLLSLVDVPTSARALQSLFDAHGGVSQQGSWEVGWALTPPGASTKVRGDITQNQTEGNQIFKHMKDIEDFTNNQLALFKSPTQPLSSDVANATTRVAVLSIYYSADLKIAPEITMSKSTKRGDFLLLSGSPFGALSPLHFYNSVTVGIISNSWPPGSSQPSLLMADIRCLPGMEGSPLFNDQASLVGVLIQPLRQRGGGAEVQLVITWEALFAALAESQLIHKQALNMPYTIKHFGSSSSAKSSIHPAVAEESKEDPNSMAPASAIDQATASVVLVTVGDGAWASGIVLNARGLILTNAHLLEPWRFGKAPSLNKQAECEENFIGFPEGTLQQLLATPCHNDSGVQSETQNMETNFTNGSLSPNPTWDSSYKSYRRIRVRLDHIFPRCWCDAKVVYVSKGPLDIALLHLESIPAKLCPIVPEFKTPHQGSRALVIGHGLFGPRSDMCPSVSAGVVARVVHTVKYKSIGSEYPAMLETTAAVHPGASGAVVVNAEGRMIGLVTSNARHGGGTVIPHLNFSIPCAPLNLVFVFASGEKEDFSLLNNIDKPNEFLLNVWAVVPPMPQRRSPSIPFLPDVSKDDDTGPDGERKKGFRFAKFIAEKGAQFSLKNKEQNFTQKGMPIKVSTTVDSFHSRL